MSGARELLTQVLVRGQRYTGNTRSTTLGRLQAIVQMSVGNVVFFNSGYRVFCHSRNRYMLELVITNGRAGSGPLPSSPSAVDRQRSAGDECRSR